MSDCAYLIFYLSYSPKLSKLTNLCKNCTILSILYNIIFSTELLCDNYVSQWWVELVVFQIFLSYSQKKAKSFSKFLLFPFFQSVGKQPTQLIVQLTQLIITAEIRDRWDFSNLRPKLLHRNPMPYVFLLNSTRQFPLSILILKIAAAAGAQI